MPREPSMDGQHWCWMTLIALQQLGPMCVSPLRKNRTTSPLHDCSSNNESQHVLDPAWSSFRRVMRVDLVLSLRAESTVDVRKNVRSKSGRRLLVWAIRSFKSDSDCAVNWEVWACWWWREMAPDDHFIGGKRSATLINLEEQKIREVIREIWKGCNWRKLNQKIAEVSVLINQQFNVLNNYSTY